MEEHYEGKECRGDGVDGKCDKNGPRVIEVFHGDILCRHWDEGDGQDESICKGGLVVKHVYV